MTNKEEEEQPSKTTVLIDEEELDITAADVFMSGVILIVSLVVMGLLTLGFAAYIFYKF